MKKAVQIGSIVVVLVVLAVSFAFLFGSTTKVGTGLTKNTNTNSFTDGADLRQNVQAVSERMSGLSSGQLLQADASGEMQVVSPSSFNLAGTLLKYYEATEAVTADNTLTVIESGSTYFVSGAAATTTLATSTPAGQIVRFVVGGALTGNHVVITNGGADVIEGSVIVAGAVVDCDAEDRLTFVGDGENVGDFFELRSTGTGWVIGSSNVLTSAKLTCTTS